MIGKQIRSRLHPWSCCLALLIAALATACSGGGNEDQIPANELAMMAVDVASNPNEIYIGRPITLDSTISASLDDQNLTVSFYLLDQADVDAELDPPRQYWIGAELFPEIKAGTNLRRCILVIPEFELLEDGDPGAALVPGTYYLRAFIDELATRADSDRQDNSLSGAATTIILKASTLPDIVIHRIIDIEDDVVILHQDDGLTQLPVPGFTDEANDHFDATLVISNYGTTTVQGLQFTAYFELSGTGIGPTQQLMPVQLWNSAEDPVTGDPVGFYSPVLTLTSLPPGIEQSIHLDVHVPAAARSALSQAIANTSDFTYEFLVFADEADLIAEHASSTTITGRADDNVISEEVIVLPPAPASTSPGAHYDQGYEKTWANDRFGIGVELTTTASLDEEGAAHFFAAKVPVKLFGKTFDFLGVDIDARHDPSDTTRSFLTARTDLLGTTLWSDSGGAGHSFSSSPTKYLKTIQEKTFIWAAVVPVSVTGKVFGGITVSFGAGIEDSFHVNVTPHVIGLAASLELAVDLIGAKVGVGGEIILLDDIITAQVDCGMALINNDTELQGQLIYSLTNEIRGPNGDLYFFVTWPRIGWGWRGPYFKTPGIKKIVMVSWVPFAKKDTLFSKTSGFLTIPLE